MSWQTEGIADCIYEDSKNEIEKLKLNANNQDVIEALDKCLEIIRRTCLRY